VNLDRELVVDASSSDVWAFLWDVDRLSRCIPGCSDVRTIAHQRSYSAVIAERVGPFRLTFPLSIEVTEIDPPRHLRLEASGSDAKTSSAFRGSMDLMIKELSVSRTEIAVSAEMTIAGRVAALGQSVIVRKANDNMDSFAAALRDQLEGRVPPREV
jgi:carbon monoxide dehydrogenase subunit G